MLVVTKDFKALLDGTRFDLKKGEEFRGAMKAAEQLRIIGLLSDKPERKKVKND